MYISIRLYIYFCLFLPNNLLIFYIFVCLSSYQSIFLFRSKINKCLNVCVSITDPDTSSDCGQSWTDPGLYNIQQTTGRSGQNITAQG